MLDLFQWPALAVTIAAGWLALSDARDRRLSGFALLFLATTLWAVWSWHVGAWALFALSLILTVPVVRGIAENRRAQPAKETPEPETAPSPWGERPDAEYAALVREGLTVQRTIEAPGGDGAHVPEPSRERRVA